MEEAPDFNQARLAERLDATTADVSRYLSYREPDLKWIAKAEKALGLPRGTILRMAGYVADFTTTEDAIKSDPLLSAEGRRNVLAFYQGAVGRSGNSVSRTRPKVPKRAKR